MDGNWNIGCKASEVFTQLEFKRKNMCVYLRSHGHCRFPLSGQYALG